MALNPLTYRMHVCGVHLCAHTLRASYCAFCVPPVLRGLEVLRHIRPVTMGITP